MLDEQIRAVLEFTKEWDTVLVDVGEGRIYPVESVVEYETGTELVVTTDCSVEFFTPNSVLYPDTRTQFTEYYVKGTFLGKASRLVMRSRVPITTKALNKLKLVGADRIVTWVRGARLASLSEVMEQFSRDTYTGSETYTHVEDPLVSFDERNEFVKRTFHN